MLAALQPLLYCCVCCVQVGQSVYAIGNPSGLTKTLTAGVVSGLNRAIPAPTGTRIYGAIQVGLQLSDGAVIGTAQAADSPPTVWNQVPELFCRAAVAPLSPSLTCQEESQAYVSRRTRFIPCQDLDQLQAKGGALVLSASVQSCFGAYATCCSTRLC